MGEGEGERVKKYKGTLECNRPSLPQILGREEK